MSRILVTGGCGFIGRHTVATLLAAGHEVIRLSRSQHSSHKSSNEDVFIGDLLWDGEPERIARDIRADLLVHLAWETEHGHFWHAESNRQWEAQSVRLVEAFWDAGGARAVCAGTCAEYDWKSLGQDENLDEDHSALVPATLYGQSKLSCFKSLRIRSAAGAGALAWGRVFLLFGSGEAPTRFIPAVIRALLANKEAPMSSGQQVRDFMDSRDVGAAFAELALSRAEGAFNISSGQGRSLLSIAEMIADKLGKRDLLRPGAYPDREAEPYRLVGSNQKLIKEVGFDVRFSLEQGLDDCLSYWRNEVDL
ncbi:NAD(P)-dependent oxidoreductase [Kiloniella laminariae]|uniref:NAD(P)-dependent oxidoreductase n=1 Tax=Kiloniella laminariae TaxID=454162 RepID=A0ABT4LE69_9PROT|nr:NAD(P)-dependent oxidoreductase [Kiloniella laminariae]MCZ4279393.1 NAD(P)-dependent oxidoreductase [Kiloniella laminariae]